MSDLGKIAQATLFLATATDMLEELVCHLGANDGELDEAEFSRVFYIAIKVAQDAAALRELVEEAEGRALPFTAKIRTSATDTGLIDHVLKTFRVVDASYGDDNPGVRASVLKAALDAWIAERQTRAAA